MVRRVHTFLVMLATALMAAAGIGCVEPLQPYDLQNDPNAVMLPVQIYLPLDAISTKAASGDVTASPSENGLRDLQIWAFSHQTTGSDAGDSEIAVAYLGLSSINFRPTMSRQILEVDMFFPGYVFNRPDDALNYDFYVLGNGGSIGFGPTETSRSLTRGYLKAKTFGNGDGRGFGTETLVTSVPNEGLPQAGFFNNGGNGFDLSFVKQKFTNEQLIYMREHHAQAYDENDSDFQELAFTDTQKTYIESHLLDNNKWNWTALCPRMTISRVVSKLRFVFAKSPELLGTGIGIVSIKLLDDKDNDNEADDTGVIPDESYVFPRENSQSGIDLPGSDYSILSMEGSQNRLLVGDTDIKEDNNPLRLCSTSGVLDVVTGKAPSAMTADEYDSFLSRWIGDKTSTERILYLRESDKPIKGRITYKFDNQVEQPVSFSMPDSPSETNFYRNHNWTVYAYYSTLQQRLEVTTSVLDWEGKNTERIDSENTVNVDQDGKFFVDPSFLGFLQMDTVYRAGSTEKVDYYEVHVPESTSSPDHARGKIAIYAPEGGTLVVTPQGNVNAFRIELESKTGTGTTDDGKIDRNRDGGRIYINVYRTDEAFEEARISLSFSVRTSDGRDIGADSEIIDERFYFVVRSTDGGRVYPQ